MKNPLQKIMYHVRLYDVISETFRGNQARSKNPIDIIISKYIRCNNSFIQY